MTIARFRRLRRSAQKSLKPSQASVPRLAWIINHFERMDFGPTTNPEVNSFQMTSSFADYSLRVGGARRVDNNSTGKRCASVETFCLRPQIKPNFKAK